MNGPDDLKDHNGGIDILKQLSRAQYADAQYMLAMHYLKPIQQSQLDIRTNVNSSLFNHISTPTNIETRHDREEETNNDVTDAVKYLKAAADNNHHLSSLQLAYLLQKGIIFKQDLKEAFKFLLKAAEGEIPEAQFMLGTYYANGIETDVDHSKAIDLYEQAANKGISNIINCRSCCCAT